MSALGNLLGILEAQVALGYRRVRLLRLPRAQQTHALAVWERDEMNKMAITVLASTYPLVKDYWANGRAASNYDAIAPTNHNRSRQHDEPITIPSNYM